MSDTTETKPSLRNLSAEAFLEIYWANMDLEEPFHATKESLAKVEGYEGADINAEFLRRMERGSDLRGGEEVLAEYDDAKMHEIHGQLFSMPEYDQHQRRRQLEERRAAVLARMRPAGE